MDIPTLTEYHQRLRDATEKNIPLMERLKKSSALIKRLMARNAKLQFQLSKLGAHKKSIKSVAIEMIEKDYSTSAIHEKTGLSRRYIYTLRYTMKKALNKEG